MTEQIVIATANAHMGRLFREPEGLEPFAEADILLLQEVHPERDKLEVALERETDLRLVAAAGELGLAIAVSPRLYVPASSIKKDILQERGDVGNALLHASAKRWNAAAFSTRARGMLGVTAATPGKNVLNLRTTHPTVPFRYKSRNVQVSRIAPMLTRVGGRLVVAGDMNHWPGYRRADLEMRRRAGLTAVDIGRTPTYAIERSRHAWLSRRLPFVPFNGQFDAMLYRGDGIKPVPMDEDSGVEGNVVEIKSDHLAIITKFSLS